MFELRDLYQLIKIADCGTISRAAEELYLSQPALSRAMQKLEGELGVALFDRAKNKVELNENGKFFVGIARSLISECEDGARRLRARDGSLREKRKHDARHRQKRQQRYENDPLCLTHNFLLLPRFPGAAIPNFLLAANVSADLSHIFSSAARRKSVFLTHAYPHSARHPQTRRA